jgi:hypothetical protein
MKTHLVASLAALALLAPLTVTQVRSGSIPAAEAAQLRSLSAPQLAELRGGRAEARATIRTEERNALQAAQQGSAGLRELKAGDPGLIVVVLLVLVIALLI